ncbi:MAG: hypothetical protein Q9165_005279 [Trypethelium subeluteriae]
MSPYPKRKRAQISYTELDSDDGEVGLSESSESDVAVLPPSKKKPKTVERPLPKQPIFPFMNLPRELRDEVYRELLTDSNGIYLDSSVRHHRQKVVRYNRPMVHQPWWRKIRRYRRPTSTTYKSWWRVRQLATHFLAVSHVVKAEAEPWLYSDNEFVVEDTTALHSFLASLTPSTRGLLRRITILGWGWGRTSKVMNLAALSILAEGGVNLHSLRFECDLRWISEHKLGQYLAKSLYRSCYLWLEAMARARGVDEALAVLELTVENLKEEPRIGWNHALQVEETQPAPTPDEVLELFKKHMKIFLVEKSKKGKKSKKTA